MHRFWRGSRGKKMNFEKFSQRKKQILLKKDKSHQGEWDEKISSLCRKINNLKDYYTTSSCSSRAVLMIDQEKKASNLFFNVYHDALSLSKLKKDILDIVNSRKLSKKNIKFKQEPCILHVACSFLGAAEKLLSKAKKAGWKKSGIIAFGKNIILELNSTERLEFPVVEKGKILVNDSLLRVVVRDTNAKLKRNWEKIKKLEREIKIIGQF